MIRQAEEVNKVKEPKGVTLHEAALVIAIVLTLAFAYIAGAKQEGTSYGIYNRGPVQTQTK